MPFHSWVARSSRPVSSGAISGASARKLTSHTVTPNSTPYSTISGGRALSWNVSASPARNAPRAGSTAAGGSPCPTPPTPLLERLAPAPQARQAGRRRTGTAAAASVALGTVIHLLLSTLL